MSRVGRTGVACGCVGPDDFVPSPLAHPHCYSICYLLMLDDGRYVPFKRLMGVERYYQLLADSLYIEPRDKLEQVFLDVIDELWANPGRIGESRAVLRTLKHLIEQLFPSEGRGPDLNTRRQIAERRVKAIYIHSHMDEENFDVSRILQCCVGVPDAEGGFIPTCAYNVLYRRQDARFADPRMLARMRARTDQPPPCPPEKQT